MSNPFRNYDQWKTASPYDEYDGYGQAKIVCKYCEKWEALGFKCSAVTHLECDCPVCQGMCECVESF